MTCRCRRSQIGAILGSFFFTYALFQVPAGWISDRFGARKMLTGYILAWSALTAMTGFMTTASGLLLTRLGCGIAQAGAVSDQQCHPEAVDSPGATRSGQFADFVRWSPRRYSRTVSDDSSDSIHRRLARDSVAVRSCWDSDCHWDTGGRFGIVRRNTRNAMRRNRTSSDRRRTTVARK